MPGSACYILLTATNWQQEAELWSAHCWRCRRCQGIEQQRRLLLTDGRNSSLPNSHRFYFQQLMINQYCMHRARRSLP